LRVVSDPAAKSNEKNAYSSTSVRVGGSTSVNVACTTTDSMSSVGFARLRAMSFAPYSSMRV
jgi:hypothetical protein